MKKRHGQDTRSNRIKQQQKITRSLLQELPFFSFTGNLALYTGTFNNSLSCDFPTKRNLECLPSFFYLDLFGMNSTLDNNLSPDNNLSIPRIQSHYFSPHSLNQYSRCLNKDRLENSLAIVHNNTTSLNRNLEKITSHYLDELR